MHRTIHTYRQSSDFIMFDSKIIFVTYKSIEVMSLLACIFWTINAREVKCLSANGDITYGSTPCAYEQSFIWHFASIFTCKHKVACTPAREQLRQCIKIDLKGLWHHSYIIYLNATFHLYDFNCQHNKWLMDNIAFRAQNFPILARMKGRIRIFFLVSLFLHE